MDEPKILSGLGQCGYSYPLTDVSHLSEKDKKDLLRRGMHIPKELHSDEEFEQLNGTRTATAMDISLRKKKEGSIGWLPQAMNVACGITAIVSTREERTSATTY